MAPNHNRPRRHSISSGDESVRPHPAKSGGLARRGTQRRARLPRSKSTSSMLESFGRLDDYTPPLDVENNVAREQADVENLRALAKFFRTTAPPQERSAPNDACLKFPASDEPRRWSLQSRTKTKRTKPQRHSLQGQLPDSAVPGTTAEGYRYIAISTPTPQHNTVTGPWFRSQYPVFAPETSSSTRKEWPERSSSREPAHPTTKGGSKSVDTPDRPHREESSPLHETSRAKHLSNGSLTELSMDYPLGTVLNTVEEGFESDLGSPRPKSAIQEESSFERPRVAPQPPSKATKLTVEAPESKAMRKVSAANPEPNTLPEKPGREEGTSAPRAPISPKQRGSPRSPSKNTRRPANINVKQTLAVPKQSLLPDSPGFPNMLAAMSFPAPPKTSRPSSPASSILSSPEAQPLQKPGPFVLPRTSSRHACKSHPMSTASLDEIVMHEPPTSSHAKSERPPQGHRMPTRDMTQPSSNSDSSEKRPDSRGPMNHVSRTEKRRGRPREEDVSTAPPRGPPSTRDDDGHRESVASQLTATTDSFRQSFLTSSLSSRSSASSDMTGRTVLTVKQATEDGETQSSRHSTTITAGSSAVISTTADTAPGATVHGNNDVASADNRSSLVDGSERVSSRASVSSSAANSETSPQPKTIHERRLARKAKVREYKLRDLDASRAECVDSPILGYFPSNPSQPRKIASQEPCPAARGSKRSSVLSTYTIASDASSEPQMPRNGTANASSSAPITSKETGDPQSLSDGGLKISPMLTTAIEPVYPPSPRWHTSGITMSPIMVVVDVESRSGASTLKLLSARPEPLMSSRALVRPKPLKIIPQTRHQAVTISRNPSTGRIERTSAGSVDLKLNRRSLITMPTPPLSPEAAQSPRRLSLPPVQFNTQNSNVAPWDRALPLRRNEWRTPPPKERDQEIKQLHSASFKDRVLREKLQKEQEITDIVANTIGCAHHDQSGGGSGNASDHTLETQDAEGLEKRLRRLERNNDAWLSAMKPLLETMARTLNDMKAENRAGSLRMSEFIVDMESEARRVSSHGRKTGLGDNQSVGVKVTSASEDQPSCIVEDQAAETEGEALGASCPSREVEDQASEAIKRQIVEQEATSEK